MIAALITGSLYKAGEQRTSKSGSKFVTASARVKTGEAMQFVRVVAFSESAQAELLRLQDGDCFSEQGQFKAEIYAKDGGEPKLSLSIVADQILALRQPAKQSKPKQLPAAEPLPKDTRSRQERCSGTWAPGGGPNDSIPFGDES
jgi:Single-strand binding protein family